MTFKGLDIAGDSRGLISRTRAAKIDFVGRYYSYSPLKNLSLTEAQALSAAGIAIVSVWEAQGDRLDNFTQAQGRKDAAMALSLAEKCMQPSGSPIYFAVDLDVSPDDISNFIVPYFVGVRAVAPTGPVGVYGSGLVLQSLKIQGLVTHLWLGGAMGWRGSHGYAGAHIVQGVPGDPYGWGANIDPDTAQGDYGGWTIAGTPVTAAPAPQPTDAISEAVGTLQAALKTGGFYSGAIDRLWGPRSQAALDAWRAGG